MVAREYRCHIFPLGEWDARDNVVIKLFDDAIGDIGCYLDVTAFAWDLGAHIHAK